MCEDYFEEEETNEFGFYQYYQVCGKTHKRYPICVQCYCLIAPNRGQGAICGQCEYEFNCECEADYCC